MAVTFYGKTCARKVKSEGLWLILSLQGWAWWFSSPAGIFKTAIPFFLEGLGSPSAGAGLLTGSTPCAVGTCSSGDRRTAGQWTLWKQGALSSLSLCRLYSTWQEACHVCLFNNIMGIQGLAPTPLVATDRNSNSLNLKEKVGFPGGAMVKNLPPSAGDSGSIPGSGRSSGEGNGNPLQYSCLENPMDGGVWRATIRGVSQSRTKQKGECGVESCPKATEVEPRSTVASKADRAPLAITQSP